MSYTPPLTATLTGATIRQLAYWRRATPDRPALLVPEYGSRPRVHYSFSDIIALRTFVRLRKEVSLQRIRRSLAWLAEQRPDCHPARFSLRAVGHEETIVWLTDDGEFIDVLNHPGDTGLPLVMESILDSFVTESGREVPRLDEPTPGVTVDPAIRGGYPVIEETRIPYNVISGLARDGVSTAEIRELYPRVTARSIAGAEAFERLVDEARGDHSSARAAG